MAVTTSDDDGFREIQLNGKQLVFLFMAVTVVLVVTFLTGVLVGRGVRAERVEAAQADALTDAPPTPERIPELTPASDDPRAATPPPTEAEDGGEPPMAAPRNPEVTANNAPVTPAPVAAAKVPAPSAAPAAAAPAPKQVASAPAKPPTPAQTAAASSGATAKTVAAPAAPEAPAAVPSAPPSGPRNGYAVQVAAVNARSEADAIVRRLSAKGYSAYVEVPKNASVFRVRVGTFRTRREAQRMAERLQKEEKFKPWVTR